MREEIKGGPSLNLVYQLCAHVVDCCVCMHMKSLLQQCIVLCVTLSSFQDGKAVIVSCS